MDLVQNLIKIKKKLSMDLVHDRGSMDPVHESGPWTPGPCFVLTRKEKRPQSVGRELYTSVPDVLNPDFTIRIS